MSTPGAPGNQVLERGGPGHGKTKGGVRRFGETDEVRPKEGSHQLSPALLTGQEKNGVFIFGSNDVEVISEN